MCSADGSIVSCHKANIFCVLLRPIVGKTLHEPVGGGCVVLTKIRSQAKHFLKSAQRHLFVRAERETIWRRKARTEDR